MAIIDSTTPPPTRRARLQASLDPRALRPVVTSLNSDNSWLWSFPRPAEERKSSGKAFYHILFEPWLNGPTGVFGSWWIHLKLPQTPAVPTAQAVEALIEDIELAVVESSGESLVNSRAGESASLLDAILLGFHYLDHVHEPTLRLFDRSIPVIATPEAAAKVTTMKHFEHISVIANLTPDVTSWKEDITHPGGSLPVWLTPLRMPGHHELNYCLALIWSHKDPPSNDNSKDILRHEAILQSPHGIRLDSCPTLQTFLQAEPATEKLAMFHGLKESQALGSINTFGAESGLSLVRALGESSRTTKYWIASHNAALSYSGAFMWLVGVRDTSRTLKWALEKEAERGGGVEGKKRMVVPEPVDVENGGFFVLA